MAPEIERAKVLATQRGLRRYRERGRMARWARIAALGSFNRSLTAGGESLRMKIEPPRASTVSSLRRTTQGSNAAGFAPALDDAAHTAGATPTRPTAALTSLDALLALQLDQPSRRRRQIRRGEATLDALDRLTATLLGGGDESVVLGALRDALAGREPSEDPGLDTVIEEIDLRAAVELAKRERMLQAA
jgi:hypothetical protein